MDITVGNIVLITQHLHYKVIHCTSTTNWFLTPIVLLLTCISYNRHCTCTVHVFVYACVHKHTVHVCVIVSFISNSSTDSDAFLTPEDTSDDEETIENEELQMEKEVNYTLHVLFLMLHTSLVSRPFQGGEKIAGYMISSFFIIVNSACTVPYFVKL